MDIPAKENIYDSVVEAQIDKINVKNLTNDYKNLLERISSFAKDIDTISKHVDVHQQVLQEFSIQTGIPTIFTKERLQNALNYKAMKSHLVIFNFCAL